MRLADRVAIVTGSGHGIGEAVARRFAAEGASVVVTDIDAAAAAEVARSIASGGGRALAVTTDVSQRAQVEALAAEAMRAFGRIDVLVNNAGVIRPAMIEKMSEDDWNAVVGVHLSGAFHCTQVIGRELLRRAREAPDPVCNGKIVNVTSVAGLRGSVGQINYASAKAGVVGLTMSAAREWGRYAINVNCVAFGLVETRMTERIRSDPKFRDQYLREIALGRYAKPEDVAPAVLFLASSDADYVTGQVLRVCGGADIHV